MTPSPNNNNKDEGKSTIIDLSSDDNQYSDDIPADPNNPYDYRHFLPGGMHELPAKRKYSSSSEASVTPPSKKKPTPSPADVQEATPKREAERRLPTVPPVATFRNAPLPPRRAVPENAARVNPQPLPRRAVPGNAARVDPQPVSRRAVPESAVRVNPQPVEPNERIAPNPNPARLPIQVPARLYAASPECRNLLFEMNSERTRHALKLRFMNEIHAVEEQLSQAKHTANMRRLQELIITENGYRRESARFEQEIETARHDQKMAHLSRQIAAEQRAARERALARQAMYNDDAVGEHH